MTKLEIDRRLALAIGYAPEDIDELCGSVRVLRNGAWQWFDHQQEHTIYPIAEHFKMMPMPRVRNGTWCIFISGGLNPVFYEHTDPRTCIALGIIEAVERGALK